MAGQWAILESIHDEAYVKANRSFIRQDWKAIGALFDELDAEANVKVLEEPLEHDLQLPPMYSESGTKIYNRHL